MNFLLIAAAAVGGLGYWAKRKYDAAKLLQPDIADVGVPKMDGLNALIIPVQALLRNPTQVEITIDYPSIKIYTADGYVLGTTAPKPEKLTIKPGADTRFPADLRIGLLDILTVAGGKFKEIKSKGLKGQTLKMDVMTGLYGYPISFVGFEKTF